MPRISTTLYITAIMDFVDDLIDELTADAMLMGWADDPVQEGSGVAIVDGTDDFVPIRENGGLRQLLEESNKHWMHMPVSAERAPRTGAPLGHMSDDEIMAAPAALVVHLMQTAANGGLQIIAPQQIPLVDTMTRTDERRHKRDMHIAGSVASGNTTWPCLVDNVPYSLFPSTPIDSGTEAVAVRRKTKTIPLAPTTDIVEDPVIRAFVSARGLIDLQGRSDVGGDARAVSDVIARAWRVSPESLASLADVSLAPTGSLLRYAARADQVMPRIYAPIHDLLCISTGTHATGRLVYGEHAALDWRRCRVMTEATFYLASRTEGYTLMDMRSAARPGDPRAPPNRPGVIQMRPRPGAVWSCDPGTFRLYPVRPREVDTLEELPDRIKQALLKYDEQARPIKIAATVGAAMSFSTTVVSQHEPMSAETVVRGYSMLMHGQATSLVRGVNAHRMVRSQMYSVLASADAGRAIQLVMIADHLTDSANELGVVVVPGFYRHLARAYVQISTAVRAAIGAEAVARGSTLDAWWADFQSSLPVAIRSSNENTVGWGTGAFWYLCNPPSDRWSKLMSALRATHMSAVSSGAISTDSLPVVRGSAARIIAASTARCAVISRVFGDRYHAMVYLADALADMASDVGKSSAARQYRLAALTWAVRSSAMRSLKLIETAPEDGATMTIAGRTYALQWSYARAADSLRRAIMSEKMCSKRVKDHFSAGGPVSLHLSTCSVPLLVMSSERDSRLFRYVRDPVRLTNDMRIAAQQATADVAAVAARYTDELRSNEQSVPTFSAASTSAAMSDLMDMLRPKARVPGELTYWQVLDEAGDEQAAIDDVVAALPAAESNAVSEGRYRDLAQLLETVEMYTESHARTAAAARDTVI
jgi:hypothetical protein